MSSIFYEYIQGDRRDNLIQEMELDCEWRELSLMLEMTQRQAEINEKRAELKVLKESGSYDDYAYLIEAGEQQAAQNQKGLLQRIFEWFAKFFNNIANKLSGTQQAVNAADPNAQVQLPSDYVDESEMQQLGAAADAMSKVNTVKDIAKIAVPGAALAALGGLIIYNKKKEERNGSPKKNVTIGQLAQQIPGMEALINKIKAAEAKLKSVFEKDPNGKVNPDQKTQTQNNAQTQQQNINNQNAQMNHGGNAATPPQNGGTVVPPNANPGGARPDAGQPVHASADTEDIGNNRYMIEAGNIVDIIGEVLQDPKVLLTYLQKAIVFLSEKLDWIKNAAASVMRNTTGPVQNAAGTVANAAANAQGVVNTAGAGVNMAQNVANAVNQNVNASADTEPITDNEKSIFESVFGEKYEEKSDEEKISDEFSAIFKDL